MKHAIRPKLQIICFIYLFLHALRHVLLNYAKPKSSLPRSIPAPISGIGKQQGRCRPHFGWQIPVRLIHVQVAVFQHIQQCCVLIDITIAMSFHDTGRTREHDGLIYLVGAV